ncbi:MAG: Ig-like domain-containing protein, partial [Caldilineaceae bacterium]
MTTSHKSLSRLSTLLLVGALLLGGLLPAAPLVAQDAPPPAGDAATIEGIERPALLGVTPEEGAAWTGEEVTWSFDRWVGISTYSITPALAGSWQVLAGEADGGSTVTFLPEATPEPGVRYRLRFQAYAVDRPELATVTEGDVEATAEAAALSVEHLLTGAVPLAVTATTPSDGASEVATSSQIVVTFNRPVVPLTGASEAEQAALPQPLAFEPPLEGAGLWLTTSIYAFNPEPGLAGATDYTVFVETLTAVGGETLAEPFT